MRKKTTEETIKQEGQQLEAVEKNLTVGLMLKQAREKKGESIEKIATALRIRPIYLYALEESNYQSFPGQAYAFGFLRGYASFLGLDVDELMTLYRKETSFIKPDELNMPISEQPTLFPSIKCLLVSLAVIVAVWAFWYFLTYKEAPIESVVEPVLSMQETILPEDVIITSEENVETVVEKEPEALKETVAPKTKNKKGSVQIVAREEVWVEIEQDDTLILSRTLKKGEKYDVPESEDELFLKTGNAGGLDVFVDGQKVKALGPVGAVRSGISLSPEKLKKR